tara:strand:- start:1325 stop:1927 length:603 start_codon:yes stop_codon:yes gene_type:complete
MKNIALTGGIGCGKTTVSKIFLKNFGIPTIDTDLLARQAVTKGSSGLTQVISRFGSDILNDKDELDRLKLKKIIFFDKDKRKTLEKIIHPIVNRLVKEKIRMITSHYCLIAVPILRKESTIMSLVDRVLFIDCKESIRIERTVLRDKLELPLVKKIIKSQPSRIELKEMATDIIQNNDSFSELNRDIGKLHEKFIRLFER